MSTWTAAFIGGVICFWIGYFMGRRRGLQMRREEVLRRERQRAEKLKRALEGIDGTPPRPATRAAYQAPTSRLYSQIEKEDHSR